MVRKVLAVVLVCMMVGVWLFTGAMPVAAADVVNLDVPRIHQENDPPDDPYGDGGWDGGNACGAASAVMMVAYYGKLPPNACGDCNGNDYSWYVNQKYTNSYGTYYDTAATDDSTNDFWGAFGHCYGTGSLSSQASLYMQQHGLVAAYHVVATEGRTAIEATIQDELDNGRPVYADSSLHGGAGHIVVIRGYTDDANTQYICNDPLESLVKKYTWLGLGLEWIITAQPDTDQTWYLSNFSAGTNRFYMYREDSSITPNDVTINDGAEEHWVADETASNNVTFPAANWHVAVTFDAAPSSGNRFKGDLGTFDGATYTPAALDSWWNFTGMDGSKTYFTHSFNPGSFTVDSGERLAFWIINTDDGGAGANLVVKGGSSYSVVISPTTDPGYPLPELPTVVLVGVGLAALGGYFMVARRRHSATKL
jgi:hypothetical protein